ncbi:MAG: sortase [Anaerolineae bacterium]|nr:MAG: sortase [Anaerolineae bacterium]
MWLGLLVLLAAFGVGIVRPQPGLSPFDQLDSFDARGQGLLPVLVPMANAAGIRDSASQLQPSDSPVGKPIDWIPLSRQDWYAGAAPVPFLFPDQISIPAIQLHAPVVIASLRELEVQGQLFQQWVAPDAFEIGYLLTPVSEGLGTPGNTVLVGHHNVYGEVFARLEDLVVGDIILVYSGGEKFAYLVTLRMILPERNQQLEVRLENAEWIAPTQDERLTLITCWPYESNTHRLVIVAQPVDASQLESRDPGQQ